jgi:two-component sensor histidine kinase
LASFLGELLDHLKKSIGSEAVQIAVTGNVEGARLATDRAVSLSLLVTELVTNAIEHAFVGQSRGRITVDMAVDDGAVTLVVADDGVGFDPTAERDGTGINLAELLAQQLGAELHFAPGEPGTRVTIELPPDRAKGVA